MHCQACHQNPATVRVIELKHSSSASSPGASAPAEVTPSELTPAEATPADDSRPSGAPQAADSLAPHAGLPPSEAHVLPTEQWLCEPCAQAQHELLHHAKDIAEVWKLLQAQKPAARKQPPGVACPECGMTLRDFRQRGRLGCPKDYEVFGAQLHDLLERLHGSARHVGRGPRQDESMLLRRRRLDELQQALASAIRDEAYEQAAALRDEIKSLEHS